MERKNLTPEQIISKLQQIDVLISQGKGVPQVSKEAGISDVSYYRWRKGIGGSTDGSGQAPEEAGAGMAGMSNHPRNLISIVIIISLALLMIFVSRRMIPDDAYIYLRIAQNVVHGYGWSYNPGAPSNAATAPFYVLILIIVEALGVTDQDALIFTYAIGLIGLIWVIYKQLIKVDYTLALFCSLSVIFVPDIFRSIGMETTIFLLTIALSAKYFEENKYGLSGFFCGLAALGRPEGMALPFMLLFIDFMRKRNINWKLLLFPLISVVPWLIFSQVEFHSIFPHTVSVKAIQGTESLWNSQNGRWFLAFLRQAPPLFLFLFFSILGLISTLKLLSKGKTFLPILVGFGVIQILGYTILHAPIYYFWYYDVGDFCFALLIAAGISSLLAILKSDADQEENSKSSWSVYYRGRGVAVSLALLSLTAGPIVDHYLKWHVNTIDNFGHQYAHLFGHYRFSNQYKLASLWLRRNSDKSTIVAADEIGYIGYYSGLKIRDMLGLIENNSLKSLERHQWSWWLTNYKTKPEYIIVHKHRWVGEPTARDASYKWSKHAYDEFQSFYVPVFSTKKLVIYKLENKSGV